MTTLRGAATYSTGSSGTANTVSVTAVAGTTTNDLILMFCAVPIQTYSFSSPNFTAVNAASGSNVGAQQLLYKIGTSSEPASYTVTMSGTHTFAVAIAVYFGYNLNLTMDPVPSVSGAVSSGSSSASISAPSVTTTQNGDKLAWFGWTDGSSTGTSPFNITVPSGFTAETSQVSTSYTGSQHNISMIMADALQNIAGATGAENGVSSSAAINGAMLVTIPPGPTGPAIDVSPYVIGSYNAFF